jgi:hypothetical protein
MSMATIIMTIISRIFACLETGEEKFSFPTVFR